MTLDQILELSGPLHDAPARRRLRVHSLDEMDRKGSQ
jgi:hypothetical protein